MNKSNRPVQGLAEISLRVYDLDAMRKFYEMKRFTQPNIFSYQSFLGFQRL